MQGFFTKILSVYQYYANHHAPRLGASIAFYTIFSLASLLLISATFGGIILNDQLNQVDIVSKLQAVFGAPYADMFQLVIAASRDLPRGVVASIIGFIGLLIGATAFINQLQLSLRDFWQLPIDLWSWAAFFRNRILSFLTVCILCLGLVAAVTGIVLGITIIKTLLPISTGFMNGLGTLFDLGVSTLFFAGSYRLLSHRRFLWSHILPGAISAAALFLIGKVIATQFITQSFFSSIYGAAGSLLAVMIWAYFTAQIIFIGAAVIAVQAEKK
jgi:membrane protein